MRSIRPAPPDVHNAVLRSCTAQRIALPYNWSDERIEFVHQISSALIKLLNRDSFLFRRRITRDLYRQQTSFYDLDVCSRRRCVALRRSATDYVRSSSYREYIDFRTLQLSVTRSKNFQKSFGLHAQIKIPMR